MTITDTQAATTALELALNAAGIHYNHHEYVSAATDRIVIDTPTGTNITVMRQHGGNRESTNPAPHHGGWQVFYRSTYEAEYEPVYTGQADADPHADAAAAVTAVRGALRDAYAANGLEAVHTYMDLCEHVGTPTAVERGTEMLSEAARGHHHVAPVQVAFTDAVCDVMHAATADHHDATDILHRALTYVRTTERPAPVDGLDATAFAGAMADLLAAASHHIPGGCAMHTACDALAQFTDEAEPRPLTIPQQHGDSRS
ncbi:hypothetical protein M8Z33_42040 [Streptomyces sp. ZAF1911]|uniref:hypothetical protein n=1 Tax=Streptomyces sp. ZAF1911 TaxID=2944129 RepID=UPI00237AD9F5|nr:hypothetical protein [Streptomyces sp. ZAF1911]MDD9383120.1 hypothetical protein [Streptomyces sp. ZAF1911]